MIPSLQKMANHFGAEVVLTSKRCRNGTERCAEVVSLLGLESHLIINVQGDSPLIPGVAIGGLVAKLRSDETEMVVSAQVPCSAKLLLSWQRDSSSRETLRTTVECSPDGRAIHFSRQSINHSLFITDAIVNIHLGIYGYKTNILIRYKSENPSEIELAEGLEQFRFLKMNVPIKMISVDYVLHNYHDVNYPSDVKVVESILRDRGVE
jgi:3-deoxy-manno-octulosonate cytidylyltransferase (CMP-KDO synthetase)